MTDFALQLDSDGLIDLVLGDGGVGIDQGLETAVLISLFSDARASDDLIAAIDKNGDLRGFWGDLDAADKTGSLLWTIKRAKQLTAVLAAARQYCVEALAWMIEDRIADTIDVQTSYPSRGWMLIEVAIYRPRQTNPVTYRFNYEWAAQALKVTT